MAKHKGMGKPHHGHEAQRGHGGKDPHASKEHHSMNSEHGMPEGVNPTQGEHDEGDDAGCEGEEHYE